MHKFVLAARLALEQAGFYPTRVGAYSFRRGRGVHLVLSGNDLRNVNTLFRHRSPALSVPDGKLMSDEGAGHKSFVKKSPTFDAIEMLPALWK